MVVLDTMVIVYVVRGISLSFLWFETKREGEKEIRGSEEFREDV